KWATAIPRTPMALLRSARSLQGFNSFLCFQHPAAVSEGIELQSFRTILADAVGPPQRQHVCIIGFGQGEGRAGTPRLDSMFKPKPGALDIALADQRVRPSERSFLVCRAARRCRRRDW